MAPTQKSVVVPRLVAASGFVAYLGRYLKQRRGLSAGPLENKSGWVGKGDSECRDSAFPMLCES
jgi:hypothetical protein